MAGQNTVGLMNLFSKQYKDSISTFIIAEIGVNHNGDVALAKKMIRSAKNAGANCVKFQTFKAERVATEKAPKAKYQTLVTDPEESQIDMLRKLELQEDSYGELIEFCNNEGVIFTSTPYNEEDLEFLVSLNVPLLKAASMHLAEPYFLKKMAATGLPLLVSTGMANWEEIDAAVEAIRSTNNEDFVLLQCTTNYPSIISDTNLNAMVAMRERYQCKIGYSDHTQSHIPCIGAVSLGARVIEKHFTLDHMLPGPDHSTSETPEQFAQLVESIRIMETALGSSEKTPSEAEKANMTGMRRSIVARKSICKGEIITDEHLTCKRPATGILPKDWNNVIGKRVNRDISEGEGLSWKDFSG